MAEQSVAYKYYHGEEENPYPNELALLSISLRCSPNVASMIISRG